MREMEVRFRTDFFQPAPGAEKDTEPGVPGYHDKSLALWLAERLKEQRFAVESVQRHGLVWYLAIACPDPAHKLFLMCGNTDLEGRAWIVRSTVHAVTFRARLSRIFQGDTPVLPELERLNQHLRKLLHLIPDMHMERAQ
ncbi:MAG: hypothetical protein LBD68_01690 [Zoogloeaceae bacterium]|jgi:hypothetical protein|nr:hypothetical protein [Zoogloeaceae bacterium]